jgi:hypothetical protein
MNRTRTFTDRALLVSALVAASAVAVLSPACSSDNTPSSESDASAGGGTGGKAAMGGSGGKAATGGNGGKAATGGNGGGRATGGTTSAGGSAGSGGTAPTLDAGEAGTALTPLTGTALVVGSDFTSHAAELVTVDLTTGHVLGRTSFADGDVGVSTDGGLFAVEHSNNALDVLSSTGTVTKRIPLALGASGPSYLNPHSPLVVTGTSKAYVPLNAANAIAIVDLTAGTQTGSISLAPFLDATDHDGSTEPNGVFYDATRHLAYFLLGRTDIFSGSANTDYTPACPPVPGLIIAVDTTTDAIAGLDADGGGSGIPLPLVGPGSVTKTADGSLLVVANGCSGTESDGGFLRTKHGIFSVDLTGRTTKVLYPGQTNAYLDELLALGDGTYALSQANGSSFRHFDPASPASLGAAFTSVPGYALAGPPGTLLGLELGKFSDGGVGQKVIRYDVSSQTKSVAATFGWSKDFSYYSAAWTK